ncbi:MAG: hypothetical protein ACLFWF_15195 [Alphaproteobacteria bacterium]
MRAIHFVAVLVAALMASACASDRQTARSTPPTPYVAMNKDNPFGVTHHDRDDGWTEILVRLNESSSRERARNMATYYAARLGAYRKAKSVYVFAEEAEMYCHVTQHRGPGVFVVGNPIAMALSLAFSAASAATTVAETFEAYPIHLLLVSFSQSEQETENMWRLPVNDTLAALKPEFQPDQAALVKASATESDAAKDGENQADEGRITEADRESWIKNAEANVAECTRRWERQKQMQKAQKDPEAADRPDSGEAGDPETSGDAAGPGEKAEKTPDTGA